jgi:hypothetical protein
VSGATENTRFTPLRTGERLDGSTVVPGASVSHSTGDSVSTDGSTRRLPSQEIAYRVRTRLLSYSLSATGFGIMFWQLFGK